MTSSYRDPNVTAALAYQAEQEQKRKTQEQPSFIDVAGRAALGLGVAALAGAGIARGLRRNAMRPVSVEDLGATAARAEENVRRAARGTTTPPPSRPAPPAGVARQQAAEEFTRQARAERPAGIQQVNIEDLGPTWYTPTAAENKATLSWLDNVVLPTEQALTRPRLPGVTQVDLTEFSPQFRSYGQVPQVAEQVVSEVKALPPARAQSTDFLRNQLGSRGYGQAPQVAKQVVSEVKALPPARAQSTDFLRNQLGSRVYGQAPQVAKQVVSEVKALPPARAQSTDFLRNQLGSRGYIEQSILDRVAEQSAGDLIDEVTAFSNKEARSELARQGASIQSQERKNLWNLVSEIQNETLVDKQQTRTGFNVDQAINALDAAEDQQTGRVKIQLQRNEDLDMGQVEVLEDIASQQRNFRMEQDEPINSVAVQLPDGLPVDQAEGASNAAQKFVSAALTKQRPSREPLLEIETKMYDLVATAAESGLKLEPKRALSILTNPGIELTTDEIKLFSINPQVGKFALKGQGYAPGQEQTGGMLSVKGDLLESVPNIGSDPQSSVYDAASGTSIRGRSRVQNQPDQFRQRLDSLGNPVREDVMSVDPGGTLTMSTGEELTELDIPDEVKTNYTRFVKNPITGRTEQEYAPKGMRAIPTVEGKTYYVPIQDPGGVGIYGEERSYASGPVVKYDMPEQERVAGAYTKAAIRKPTDMPFVEKAQGGAGFSSMNNDQLQTFITGAVSKTGPGSSVVRAGIEELNRRQASQRSLEASEALRRGNIEGRDPQMILKQFGIGT